MPKKPSTISPATLNVSLDGQHVGTLAQTVEGPVAFQYSEAWLQNGFSISPRSLPLDEGVFVPQWQPFAGLFGVFHDSLPDGWGALLLDRMLARQGIDPATIGPLARLAIVGNTGRGGLSYQPEETLLQESLPLDLDELAQHCRQIFDNAQASDPQHFDAVYAAGGSSGGARPKAYFDDAEGSWLVKFPSRIDPENIGQLEYNYALCAQSCGIDMPDVRLFPSKICGGYFASRRFDREGTRHIHMLSASGLLEVSHRVPALDYRSLFQLSYFLTGSSDEAEQLFRRMCFNVFAHNHDDHSNNFSWLCEQGVWRLAPAYDLTYSSTAFGGHTTTVLGNGNPGIEDVLALAKDVGLSQGAAKRIAEQVQEACQEIIPA